MRVCPECGKEDTEYQTHCAHCGASISTISPQIPGLPIREVGEQENVSTEKERGRQNKTLQFLLGFIGWVVLWSAVTFVFIAFASSLPPRISSFEITLLVLMATPFFGLIIILLLIWKKHLSIALGYIAAYMTNSLILVIREGSFDFWRSFIPFFFKG